MAKSMSFGNGIGKQPKGSPQVRSQAPGKQPKIAQKDTSKRPAAPTPTGSKTKTPSRGTQKR